MTLAVQQITDTDLPPRVQEAQAEATQRLQQEGVTHARLDVRLLLAAAMQVTPETVLMQPDRLLTVEQQQVFARYVARRTNHEPVSRILGLREFWSMAFEISPDVLDPRPDSETLVEAAVAFGKGSNATNILDLGTGSGCLLLATLSELPKARGTGVDISMQALAVAERNAMRHGLKRRVRLAYDDWGKGLDGTFDLILSNPPYIATDTIPSLAPDVAQFDPRRALDGGADGLACYHALLPVVKARLAPKGRAFIELGAGQAQDVAQLAVQQEGLHVVEIRQDLAAVERCIILQHG